MIKVDCADGAIDSERLSCDFYGAAAGGFFMARVLCKRGFYLIFCRARRYSNLRQAKLA